MASKRRGLFASIIAALIAITVNAPAGLLTNSSKFIKSTGRISSRFVATTSKSIQRTTANLSRLTHHSVSRIGEPILSTSGALLEVVGQAPKIAINTTAKAVVDGGKEMGKGLKIEYGKVEELFPNKALFPEGMFKIGGIKFGGK
jgi:hypothetical protein